MELNGAIAIVTGAARGIGRAVAEACVSRGARAALVDVLAPELQQTAADLRADGSTVLPIVTDITDAAQVDDMVRQAETKLGPTDMIVNCAGTFSYIGPVWEADPEKWFRDTRVNLFGTFLCCRAAARHMVERGRGYIINLVGGGTGSPSPHNTSYASSKAALMRLSEGLAKEVESHGIKVFIVGPPVVLSEMTRFIMNDPGGKKWRPNFKQQFDEGRDYPPKVVADLVVRLVSGDADALSGRFFSALEDFDGILAQQEAILREDRLTLRIRHSDWESARY